MKISRLLASGPRLRAGSLATAGLVALLLAACGGGDSDTLEPTATLAPRIASTQALVETTPIPPTQEVQAAQEYVIQPGDTLGAIADQFGVTVEALAAANDIADPDIIQPGDSLTIPSP